MTQDGGTLCDIAIISTHTPLAGRDKIEWFDLAGAKISTHTPLAGRDPPSIPINGLLICISTHTPLAGRD